MKIRWKYSWAIILIILFSIMLIPLVNAENHSHHEGEFKQDGQDVAWTQNEFHNQLGNFQFAIVSDRTRGFILRIPQ